MSVIFAQVKAALHSRLADVLPELLPGGRQRGREYVCASLEGGRGDSCSTNLDTGVGSDFATGESWRGIIDLWAKIRNIRQGEAAKELADKAKRPRSLPNAIPSFRRCRRDRGRANQVLSDLQRR
jgi:putative DNA primase/helicase